MSSSADGGTILFQDLDVYDPIYIWRNGAVKAIAAPGHAAGNPIAGRLAPDGAAVVFDDGGRLWRYDVVTDKIAALADFGGRPVEWYVFTSPSSLAVLVSLLDTPIHPTQLWTLDLGTGVASQLGHRKDAEIVSATVRGPVLKVDISTNHNGSGSALYLVAPDGSDSLVYERNDAHDVAVSPDGLHLAYSRGSGGRDGVWLVDLTSRAERRLAGQGVPFSFSPDSRHVGLADPSGSASSYALDGTLEGTLPIAARAVWLAGG